MSLSKLVLLTSPASAALLMKFKKDLRQSDDV